jgi:polygalacturonase
MPKQRCGVILLKNQSSFLRMGLSVILTAASLVGFAACGSNDEDTPPIQYMCETDPTPSSPAQSGVCGAGDPKLPPEPTFPTEVCQTLKAVKDGPTEGNLDTSRIQTALTQCKGGAVKLVADGPYNSFVTGHLMVSSVTLWIDAGVTLYASRDPEEYQKTGNCGRIGISDSGACTDFITVDGTSPAVVGDGVIDGQGGEPLLGYDYSWWQASYALRSINGSIGNPTLINTTTKTTGLLLYRITLHNSPKFHVKIGSNPEYGPTECRTPGDGYTVWGITILTPSKWKNSKGEVLTPSFARNSDGIDPGSGTLATCGVIACSTISTGDDHIAVKGGHWVWNLVIAHNHFGTGHGMSIGSETFGGNTTPDGVAHRGIEDMDVYDLTIDATSRPVGYEALASDFNGIRIKSDESRGGVVRNIHYTDICMRDMTNAILISTAYNPLFSGNSFPEFGAVTFRNVRHVTCMGIDRPVVTLEGFNATLPLGPVTMDNVVIDNMGKLDVAAEYADIQLGPGDVNFTPSGFDVNVTDNRVPGSSTPRTCVFPTLPAPQAPPGWLR